jgi:hypothetical protein
MVSLTLSYGLPYATQQSSEVDTTSQSILQRRKLRQQVNHSHTIIKLFWMQNSYSGSLPAEGPLITLKVDHLLSILYFRTMNQEGWPSLLACFLQIFPLGGGLRVCFCFVLF